MCECQRVVASKPVKMVQEKKTTKEPPPSPSLFSPDREKRNLRVIAAVKEYIGSNPSHRESILQLYCVFDRLFQLFDAFGQENGAGRLHAFLAVLLQFTATAEELDTVWLSVLLQNFDRDRHFVLSFDPFCSRLFEYKYWL